VILGHNREDFWEIPESISGKFSSIIEAGILHDRASTPASVKKADW